MEPATERPRVVTVIGWLFIVYGGLAILTALMGIAGLAALKALRAAGLPLDMQGQGPALAAMARAPGLIVLSALARIVVGMFVIVTAASFLRLRSWSRVGLQLFCWLAIPYTLISGMIGIRALPRAMAQTSGAQMSAEAARLFAALAAGFTVVVIIVLLVLYALAIWALRLSVVRQAMAGGQARAPAGPGLTS